MSAVITLTRPVIVFLCGDKRIYSPDSWQRTEKGFFFHKIYCSYLCSYLFPNNCTTVNYMVLINVLYGYVHSLPLYMSCHVLLLANNWANINCCLSRSTSIMWRPLEPQMDDFTFKNPNSVTALNRVVGASLNSALCQTRCFPLLTVFMLSLANQLLFNASCTVMTEILIIINSC